MTVIFNNPLRLGATLSATDEAFLRQPSFDQ